MAKNWWEKFIPSKRADSPDKELADMVVGWAEKAGKENPNKVFPIPAYMLTITIGMILQDNPVLRMTSDSLNLIARIFSGKQLDLHKDLSIRPGAMSRNQFREFLDRAFALRDDLNNFSDIEKVIVYPTGKELLTLIREIRSACS